MENKDDADASLLEARAEILFEQAEAIIAVLEEQQAGIESKHKPSANNAKNLSSQGLQRSPARKIS